MRRGIKNFKEFHQLTEWKLYVRTYMSNTDERESDTDIKIVTGRGETIAVWQKHGYGFVEECRTSDRLTKMLAA